MIENIRRVEDLRDGENEVEFNVYRCLTDEKTIYGYMRHPPCRPRPNVVFEGSAFGVPVAVAFRRACQYAEAHGIPIVIVNDPHGLFPEPQLLRRRGSAGA